MNDLRSIGSYFRLALTLLVFAVGLASPPAYAETIIRKPGGPIARGEALSPETTAAVVAFANSIEPGLGDSFVAGGGVIVVGEEGCMLPKNNGVNNGTDIGVRKGANTAETLGRIIHEMMHVKYAFPSMYGEVGPCTHASITANHYSYLMFMWNMLSEIPDASPPSCTEFKVAKQNFEYYVGKCILNGGTPSMTTLPFHPCDLVAPLDPDQD